MATLIDIARHWARQTQKGKGIRIEAADLDLLNAIGVGEMIQAKAAAELRELSGQRLLSSAAGRNGMPNEENADRDAGAFRPSRSASTTKPLDAASSARRVQRVLKGRKAHKTQAT